jgi:lipoate-protein ligase A
VRRASGGGAIVHDRELTYSIALPLRDVRTRAATELYNACHESLIETLAHFGVAAALYGRACSAERSEEDAGFRQPFLCFARRTCGDIVCGPAKIVGSAQRRRRGAVLQHGSILLSKSPCARELPGIAQLTGCSIEPVELTQAWTADLARTLESPAATGELSDAEIEQAQLHTERFASPAHALRR